MRFRFPSTLLAAVILAATAPLPAAAEFTGELLIAPPPPNWTGGAEQANEEGKKRIWRRTFPADQASMETIQVIRNGIPDELGAPSLASTFALKQMAACDILTPPEIEPRDADLGSAAFYSLICSRDGITDSYIETMALAGDFTSYVVVREWVGNLDAPESPVNSPRLATSWSKYFSRIRLCNTLEEGCSTAHAARVHANPRFKKMRALQKVERSVLATDQILKVASILGDLTGRAETCGEDISPLIGKIDRMFEEVAENDQDSSSARDVFDAGRVAGGAAQEGLSRESCGDILRSFRAHPSRVGAFYKYVEKFL